jgi:outer membrane protein OmpA-like peptidoglycan-associated protein
MNTTLRTRTAAFALVALGTTTVAGCATLQGTNKTERGAVIGAAAGGVAGGVIGNNTGLGTTKGAILGAVVGGAAGALIGRQMDKQATELSQEMPNGRVERVGEGIQVTFDSGILFPFDSDQLQPNGRANLRELAASLQEYPGSEVLIVGHTDAVGTDSYNYTLSQRRSQAAASYLASLGVARSRVDTQGRGESEPVASNASDVGRQQNRRVEVAIYASEAYREQARRQVGR